MFNIYSNRQDKVSPQLVKAWVAYRYTCPDLTSVRVCQTKQGQNLGGVASESCKNWQLLREFLKTRKWRRGGCGATVQQELGLKFRLRFSDLVQNLLRAPFTNQGPPCAQQVWCVWRLSVEFLNPG